MSFRYIGNKTKLAEVIGDLISRVVPEGGVVADPMCGTASMSVALKQRGYKVVAGDLMTFAVQHAKVRLNLSAPPLFSGLGLPYEVALKHLNTIEPVPGLFFREYSDAGAPVEDVPPRKYFTGENAQHVDAILQNLASWSSFLTDDEEALLRHDLVLAINRVANIAGTYGHYRSTFSDAALKKIELRPYEFDSGPVEGHTVIQGPVEKISRQVHADACYLDPPYMKRQYAANYHLLETVARGDQPRPVGRSGLRDWWDQYSDFCSKRKISSAFEKAILPMDCPVFFISYSEDGLLRPEQMIELLGKFGDVERHEFSYKRFKSNVGGAGGMLQEHLYELHRR